MKLNILCELKDTAWGGGNQFLKCLRDWLISENLYEEIPENADVILFNSNPDSLYDTLDKLIYLKNDCRKVVVNRVDGPINIHRKFGKLIDNANSVFTKRCDGTIYQSGWSKAQSIDLGIFNQSNAIIINAPDRNIFNRCSVSEVDFKKIKLISTSWSQNANKGFDVFKWLDHNLNFDGLDFSFIGNCPLRFDNINFIGAMDSYKLAAKLKESHIYLTASRKDACSNSLIEAMHCGLPAIACNDGGNPEIVGKGGELFDHADQIPDRIEKIVADYDGYRSRIELPTIDEVGRRYYEFCEAVSGDIQKGIKKLKRIEYCHRVKIKGWLELHSFRKRHNW